MAPIKSMCITHFLCWFLRELGGALLTLLCNIPSISQVSFANLTAGFTARFAPSISRFLLRSNLLDFSSHCYSYFIKYIDKSIYFMKCGGGGISRLTSLCEVTGINQVHVIRVFICTVHLVEHSHPTRYSYINLSLFRGLN